MLSLIKKLEFQVQFEFKRNSEETFVYLNVLRTSSVHATKKIRSISSSRNRPPTQAYCGKKDYEIGFSRSTYVVQYTFS